LRLKIWGVLRVAFNRQRGALPSVRRVIAARCDCLAFGIDRRHFLLTCAAVRHWRYRPRKIAWA
jgi:hypothetical protein